MPYFFYAALDYLSKIGDNEYMIKSFSVSNFKRIERNVTIDFSKVSNYEFNKECIKNNLINTAVLLGKNGSGKSSVVTAMFDIIYNLTDKYIGRDNYTNYLNLVSDSKEASFCYVFEIMGKRVIYTYRKSNLTTFIAEKLEIEGETVINYDRSINEAEVYLNFPETTTLKADLKKLDISLVKYIKGNSETGDSEKYKIFLGLFEFVEKMLLFWSLETRSFIGYASASKGNIVEEIVARGHFTDLQKFFREAGINEELTHKTVGNKEQLFFKYKNGKELEFSSACSTGMSSLLLLFYWLEDINSNNENTPSFVCIDEFDAFYHFELSQLILNKLKRTNCQVLLTTQNTTLLGNDILRPDCYFLLEDGKIANLPERTDKELRLVHNIEKLYRGGTFGL